MRILLVEDDDVLLDILLKSLTHQHYIVDTAKNGQIGWEYAESTHYDLIVLDVELPKLDGITLCQKLRAAEYTVPILLITARDASNDRVRGLDAGADDYLVKPLDLAELQARIRALLRRGDVAAATVLQVSDLRLDPSSCQVSYQDKPLTLTPKEYSLLEIFLRNPSRVFSRGQLVEHLWTFDDPPQEDSVKAHIKGLRQKLKTAGAVDWIENVYGLGYRLREGVGEKGQQQIAAISRTAPIAVPEAIAQTTEQRFDQERDKLWQQYRGLMAERVQILQTAAIAVENHTLSEDLRQDARRAAHKLAGVLGMFDRQSGTDLARQIEDSLTEQDISILTKDPLTAPAQKLIVLIQELDSQLALTEPEAAIAAEPARLLLIEPDPILGRELQALGQSVGLTWHQAETLDAAKTWLQTYSPDVVVLSIDLGQRESLALLTELSTRSPAIPVLVLAAADGLIDRVTVARSGGQGFLAKPVTAAQVWEATARLLQQTQSRFVNVLVVDDDPIFLAVVRSILEPWGLRMTGLDAPMRFWEVLRSTAPDLLILDIDMPEVSGIELCQAVRIDPEWQHLPILFLTRHSDRETIQQVFSVGGDDYATKPVVGAELIARIINRLDRSRLLQTLSTQDPLTGLSNQPQSSRDLHRLLELAEQTAQSCCLIVLALTELHQINFNYGHWMGNQVLQQISGLLRAAFSAGDVTGYWGNGEFVVGMAGLTTVQAEQRCAEFLGNIRRQRLTTPDGSQIQAIVQVGMAEYPLNGLTLQALYQAAVQSFRPLSP